jgi:L-fuculose-phosphate aldolase
MVKEQEVKEAFCEIGRRVWQRQFIAANDGNFSFRLDQDRVVCTPTIISKGFMKPEDMVVVDLEGKQLSGERKMTSEVRVHLFIYQNRPDVHSVVHVHPPHATAFAIAHQQPPEAVLPEAELNLGPIPLVPYVTPGTWEFARSIEPWVKTHDCFLMSSHGAITVGQDPYDAYFRMEVLDQYCRILLLAKQAGGWKTLNEAAMNDLMEIKRKLGIPDPRMKTSLERPDRFVPHPGPLTDEPKAGYTIS